MSTPVYGTRDIKPRARRTRGEVTSLRAELLEIVAAGKPMTVRQIFYQATVRGLVPKDEGRGYKVVQRLLVQMREEGQLPYRWITDSLRIVRGYTRWGSAAGFAQDVASLYRRDYWAGAAVRVEIWIEKDALASVIAPVVIDEWGLDLHVSRGFSSVSYLQAAAEAIKDDGRPTYVYVLSDFDPSGMGLAQKIGEELIRRAAPVAVAVERLAVSKDQIEAWALPSRPTKTTDSRAKKFIEEHGDRSVELDAIPPATLRMMVSTAIACHANSRQIAMLRKTEKLEREGLARLGEVFGRQGGGA